MFIKIKADKYYQEKKFFDNGFTFFSNKSENFLHLIKLANNQCKSFLQNYHDKRFTNKEGESKHLGNPHYNNKIFNDIIKLVTNNILKTTFPNKNFYTTHSKISYKVPGLITNWYPHQDNGYKSKSFRGFSVAVFLEDADENNGSLELFPKSHKYGTLEHIKITDIGGWSQLSLKNELAEIPNLLEAKAGDVVVFDLDTVHQSKNNNSQTNRFVFIFEIFEFGQNNKYLTLDEDNRVPILLPDKFSTINLIYKTLNMLQKTIIFILKNIMKKKN